MEPKEVHVTAEAHAGGWYTFNLDPEIASYLKKNLDPSIYEIELLEPGTANVGPVIYISNGMKVAGIGALSAVLVALITYTSEIRSGEIKITGSSGRSIEVPKGTKKEDIDFYINKAKEIDGDSISVLFDQKKK